MQGTIASTLNGGGPDIPDKLYFRIGEVSQIVGVKPYVLRFWEREFPAVAPKKSGRAQRLYRRKDVETLLEIKRLLYDKRFTIEGARKTLHDAPKPVATKVRNRKSSQPNLFASKPDLTEIRRELAAILGLLD